MRRPLQNLHLLKADMEKKGWMIDSFKFRYKKINYIVLVILFSPDEPKEKYALVQLDFLNAANFNHHLLVSANAGGIMLSAEELRRFLEISFSSLRSCLDFTFRRKYLLQKPKSKGKQLRIK